jgi:5-(carboxyamino)imidazole ribonucleotide mutase
MNKNKALVGVIMGSDSDWPTMQKACAMLDELDISYEKQVVSAHRTPDIMAAYGEEAREKGIKVIIAGAGGAAHLPGMTAAYTTLPVVGVPIKTSTLSGLDSLYSIVQMPTGVPVATVAIGKAGNAGLLAARILSTNDEELANQLANYHDQMAKASKKKTENLT